MFNVNMYFIHVGFPFIVSQGGLVTHKGDWEICSVSGSVPDNLGELAQMPWPCCGIMFTLFYKSDPRHYMTWHAFQWFVVIELVFYCRVHELFLYNDDLKKAKFRFGEFISHRNLVTNQLDMKVHVTEIFVNKQIKKEDQIKYSLYMYTVPSICTCTIVPE